ncbi:MAG TPA: iron export ABC transporter permease subunit FetB [Burkholderiaceae bacterium]|nr:iron export ABC transporter permease subunit FetB [Burkholderiaceae bacterium]
MNTIANIPSWLGVAASVVLVMLAMTVSARGRLGLTKEIAVAAIRAFVQLLAVGALLLVVFEKGGMAAAFGWLAVMVVIAAGVAGRRAAPLPHAMRHAGMAIAMAVAVTVGALLALQVIAATPEVVIPVGGMVVSAAMAATALTLRRVVESAQEQRERVEARLSLGFSAGDAFAPEQQSAVKTALVPAIDTTKVVGLISLPGAMTGLILAGVDPLEAIRYQIVVMYMLLSAAALAAMLAARFAQRSLFSAGDRLVRLDVATANIGS